MALTHNAGSIVALMQGRARAVPDAMARAAQEKARVVTLEAKNIIASRIYAIPVKTTKGGKPAWRRTRNLIQGERAVAVGVDVEFTNDRADPAAVAGRHQLGAPKDPTRTRAGGPPRQVRPPQQSVQWRSEALKNTRGRTLRITASRLLGALKGER